LAHRINPLKEVNDQIVYVLVLSLTAREPDRRSEKRMPATM
jgi:hypothetical protein